MDFQDNQNLIDNKEEKLLEPGIATPQVVPQPAMPDASEIILEVKNLTVSFGEEKVVDKLSSAENIDGKKFAALCGRIFQNEKSGERTDEKGLVFRGHNGRAVS